MASPIRDKIKLWASRHRGIKSRVLHDSYKPASKRKDVSQLHVKHSLMRGSRLQELRLKYYPSIDIDYDKLYSGKINGSIGDAEDKLVELGFRNDVTAYVEVTEQYGPDDGSFSKQYISERGTEINIPRVMRHPTFWRRTKEQLHTTLFKVGDEVHLCTHKEISAWLQPVRHVFANEESARQGVQQMRWIWYNEFESELDGKDDVYWPTEY